MYMDSLEFKVDSEIILNSRHDTAYEFQEHEKALSDLGLASVGLYGFDNCLHYLGVVARMNACLLHINMGMLLHCHCLLGVVSGNVLKYLGLGKRVSFLVETGEPQPGSLSVEIVSYA